MNCPAWIESYAAWHDGARLNASSPSLTIRKRDHQGIGYGNLFRVFFWALRFSAATRRVLYIDAQQRPVLFTDIVRPARIGWLAEESVIPKPEATYETGALASEDPSTIDALLHIDADGILCADAPVSARRPAPEFDVDVRLASTDVPCMWRALFRPSLELEAAIAEARVRAFGDATSPYAAVHLRGGNQDGEGRVDRGEVPEMLVGGLFCARQWGLPTIFVAADDTRLRRLAASGGLAGVKFFGPSVAAHTTYSADKSRDTHFATVVELGLLAHAQCLVISSSTFSDAARWWGGSPCVRYVGRPPLTQKWSPANESYVDDEPSAECYAEFRARAPHDNGLCVAAALAAVRAALEATADHAARAQELDAAINACTPLRVV